MGATCYRPADAGVFTAPGPQSTPAVPLQRVAARDWEALRARLPAAQARWAEASGFVACEAEVLRLPAADGSLDRVLIGLGEGATAPDTRAGAVLWSLAGLPAQLPAGVYAVADAEGAELQALALGWALGAPEAGHAAARPRLVLPLPLQGRVLALAAATAWVRRLVNAPANVLGPVALAAEVRALAARHGAQVQHWAGEDLPGAGFPLVHAVGRAAAEPPQVVRLDWGEAGHPRLVLVGKGVCFDSGGLDIKAPAGMRWMKKDMGGAAHALALAELVLQARLPLRLTLLVPAAENAVGAGALRPGDVVRAGNGLGVEIENTDAEGRLLLADALHHGVSQPAADAALVIDLATLTGAARMALGPELPALFSPDDALAEDLLAGARRQHDALWRLPLWQPYGALLQSASADLLNAAAVPQGGAITAALFLQRFVPAGTPWLHLDLFAWNGESRPGRPKGGEAQGLRALFDLLERHFPPPTPAFAAAAPAAAASSLVASTSS